MANVTGVVEVIMTNKFNQDKIAMKLVDNDVWYGQSKEWMEVMPKRGDTVSFSPGKQKDGTEGKYIQYLEILNSAAPEAAAPAAKSGGGGFNALGVELGHAANNAVQLAIATGDPSLDYVKVLTKQFYDMMRGLRLEIEGEGKKVVQEKAPKASTKQKAQSLKKAEPEVDFEDDIPF